MKKEQVDLENAVVWIPDLKTPNGIAEVPLTNLAVEAFRDQIRISGKGICRGRGHFGRLGQSGQCRKFRKWFKIKEAVNVGA